MSARIAIIEQSACYAIATYLDINGVSFIPAAVRWRVDDITNGVNTVPWTVISAPTASDTVTVPGIANARTSTRNTETREVLFEITDDFGMVDHKRVQYDIVASEGVSQTEG